MILDFYQLKEQPFGATPDTRYLFAGATHREALASILFGIDAGRGFVALIATPGMGKTTLLFQSLGKLAGKAKTVFMFQTVLSPLEFLRTLLRDLGDDPVGGLGELQARLTDILAELSRQGQQLVVVIDEAQSLENNVLEFVRMLSNFETPKGKLMQIILAGQPQLASKLSSPDLVQLRQRVSVIAHLKPFSAEETGLYIKHRLKLAGRCAEETLFTPAAVQLIAEHSSGIPRNINTLCFNALAIGCALRKAKIDVDVLREVISDLDLAPMAHGFPDAPRKTGETKRSPSLRAWLPRTALSGVALLALSTITPATEGRVKAQVVPAQEPTLVATTGSGNLRNGSVSGPTVRSGLEVSPSDAENPSRRELLGTPAPAPRQESILVGDRIRVTPGMTLSSLCAQLFTDCHTKEMDALRQLNPWLLNGNQIEVGQTIRIPPSVDRSSTSDASAKTLSSEQPKGVMSQ